MAPKSRPKKSTRSDAAPAVAADTIPGIGHNHPPEPIEPSLLLTRKQAGRILNCSNTTLIRMEVAGVLRAIKLVPGTHGQTYYTRTNINAVAEHGAAGGV